MPSTLVKQPDTYLTTRMKEHLRTDKQSHIYKHIKSSDICCSACDESCFSILDYASSHYALKIKEGMHIEWAKPDLNKQVKCLATSICV